MKKLLASAVLAAAVFASAFVAQAADKDTPADAPKTEKKNRALPFNGKIGVVDKAAKTISVGKRTFHITSETRINKSGKPATLDDGVIGEDVSGYVKPTEDGKLVATKVNFGPKVDTTEKDGEKKKQNK